MRKFSGRYLWRSENFFFILARHLDNMLSCLTFGLVWQDVSISLQASCANVILTRVSYSRYTHWRQQKYGKNFFFHSNSRWKQNEVVSLFPFLPLTWATKTIPWIQLFCLQYHCYQASDSNVKQNRKNENCVFVCNLFW